MCSPCLRLRRQDMSRVCRLRLTCYAWRRPTASPFLNSKASSSSSSFTKRRRGGGDPFLEEAIKAVESRAARRELNRIVQAWETADRGSLERLLVEMRAQSSVGSRFTVDTILLGRHPQMVRKIEMMMAGGKPHVFAVGALHLVARKGWSNCCERAATR